jgi:hypothetical protein
MANANPRNPEPAGTRPAAAAGEPSPEDLKKAAVEKAKASTVTGHPRTSGAPEIYAGQLVPSEEADRKAAVEKAKADEEARVKKAEAGLSVPPEFPPESQHSVSRKEMQVRGLTDEALATADDLRVDRRKLLDSPGAIEALKKAQLELKVDAVQAETPGGAGVSAEDRKDLEAMGVSPASVSSTSRAAKALKDLKQALEGADVALTPRR